MNIAVDVTLAQVEESHSRFVLRHAASYLHQLSGMQCELLFFIRKSIISWRASGRFARDQFDLRLELVISLDDLCRRS